MKFLPSSLLLISSLIALVAAQDFAVGGTCVFPVVFYVSDRCNGFWGGPKTNITADGQCHYIPPSKYTPNLGPGPYYSAVCGTDGQTIKFTKAACTDPTCTQCDKFSAYINSTSQGVFNMSNTECQDLRISSFKSDGPTDTRAETGTEPPLEIPIVAQTASPTAAPVVTPTLAPVTAAPVVPCAWYFRYYNRTYTQGALPTCSNDIYNLIGAQQKATIIADGQCHDSGVSSLGFYQAMCDGSGGVVFTKNKCMDATCEVCDADSDVYTGTSYTTDVCRDHDSSPLKAWVLYGSCNLPSCAQMTTRAITTTSYSLYSSP